MLHLTALLVTSSAVQGSNHVAPHPTAMARPDAPDLHPSSDESTSKGKAFWDSLAKEALRLLHWCGPYNVWVNHTCL